MWHSDCCRLGALVLVAMLVVGVYCTRESWKGREKKRGKEDREGEGQKRCERKGVGGTAREGGARWGGGEERDVNQNRERETGEKSHVLNRLEI